MLTFAQSRHIRVIEVLALGARRGPATEAQGLYRDLDPPQPRPTAPATATPRREPGSGRPTKKERRAIDSIKP